MSDLDFHASINALLGNEGYHPASYEDIPCLSPTPLQLFVSSHIRSLSFGETTIPGFATAT